MDSTIWDEPPHVRVMFLTMLALKDWDHVVRLTFRRLVKKANLNPVEEESVRLAREALKILSEPDPRQTFEPQEQEGRRIQQVEDGWLVINGQKYQDEMTKLLTRVRKTQWQREKREAEREHKEGAPKRREILRGSGKLSERLRAQAEKDGDKETVKRLDEIEGKENPAAAEFREKFNRTLAEVQGQQSHPARPLPPDEVRPPDPEPEGEPLGPEGVAPGEKFPEV